MGWELISSNRLEWINGRIREMKVKMITYDMDETPIYRNYIPVGYKNWDEFLDKYLI